MSSSYNPGRVAGCLYLLLGFSVFRPIYIAGALIVRDDATMTGRNIAAHELLFRLGILTDLLAGISCILVALALYQVLKGVDQGLAVLMVILGGLMPCVIEFINVLNDIAALQFARGEPFLSVFAAPQQAALAMLFLRVHSYGELINEIFAGLWLFPFGVLVFRSMFLPRLLGIGLFISGFGYLLIALTGLLAPQYVDRVSRIASAALLGEGGIVIWLLIKGAQPQQLHTAAASQASA
ncbi:MAG: DUF4386 domain-containing protein [Acidobacteriia bacterium]|nr:DUF4386 domain-containing protein [Terriglobia bacterium]